MADEVKSRLQEARAELRARIRKLEETFALALHVGLTLLGCWLAVVWLGVAMTAVLVAGLVLLVAALAMFVLWVRLELVDLRREGEGDGRG